MKIVPVAYLSSYLLSLLGNSIAAVALPLIVLQVTGSALSAGIVAAATAVPAVLAGLFMGVVIDRINRRTSSVVTDLVSAASVAALPVIDMITGLSVGWFVLFGIIGSLGDVPGMTARDALLPAIVRHGSIASERLVGIRESLGAGALLLGPAAAGTLMAVFDGSTLLWVTATTSLIAALLTLLIPHSVGKIAESPATVSSSWQQLREGWRVLFGSTFLLATTMLSVASVIVLAALQGLILPVYFTLAEQPGRLGFVLTALAAGTLVGGAIYAVTGSRVRRRTWFVTGLAGISIGFAVIATLSSVWVVFGGAFVVGLASGSFGSLLGVLMLERIPDDMRGRVMGTQNAVLTAAPSVGILGAALLTQYGSVNVAAVVLTGVWFVAVVVFARSLLGNLEPENEQTTNDKAAVAIDA
ncbi:MFS transporter [Antrihabitans sp. NCIMB 15449]|uniref:Multidrug efflux pump Tap n=1 Tax=Antrihabitans spumae TaxID=3373370 RepID=A0ABW7JQM9_9NOCA